ncbi:unnamed protein product [Diabrotica balteata]|uniref:Uncharacterized protein n=1 Tax=Diabrotica balteata TaxID=107213 RepID=A0A9N9XGU5_DIABA|nr:unnamed protein product [Diabrotica balteata]
MLPDPEDFNNIFHEAYKVLPEHAKKRLEWKRLKKKSVKARYKQKNKFDSQCENDLQLAPEIELPGNASAFAVFASIRLAVLDRWMKQASQEYLNSSCSAPTQDQSEIESDTEDNSQSTCFTAIKVSKIVGLGLRSVFELIKESRITHPVLCTKALTALLDVLQGQAPEALKCEPPDVIDSLFELLLDLATLHGPESFVPNDGSHFTAVACACLLSLVVVKGDTGKYLSASAALLMCPRALSLQNIQMPAVLSSLQKSVHGVLLGKTIRPDWITHGVPNVAKINSFHVKFPSELNTSQIKVKSLAYDGQYLYLFTSKGLLKVGSGYGGTLKGYVVLWKPDFYPNESGSLVFCNGNLYLKLIGRRGGEFLIVERSNLLISGSVPLHNRDSSATVVFSDGDYLGVISPAKDDGFVVRMLNQNISPASLVSELPLKLARKCVDVFGVSSFDEENGTYTVNTGSEEEIITICTGKEFGLIRTITGKVLYCGKSSALGIKQSGVRTGKWSELIITKAPKINQVAIGHDGLHAVLLTDDGSVFFTVIFKMAPVKEVKKQFFQVPSVSPKLSNFKSRSTSVNKFLSNPTVKTTDSVLPSKKSSLVNNVFSYSDIVNMGPTNAIRNTKVKEETITNGVENSKPTNIVSLKSLLTRTSLHGSLVPFEQKDLPNYLRRLIVKKDHFNDEYKTTGKLTTFLLQRKLTNFINEEIVCATQNFYNRELRLFLPVSDSLSKNIGEIFSENFVYLNYHGHSCTNLVDEINMNLTLIDILSEAHKEKCVELVYLKQYKPKENDEEFNMFLHMFLDDPKWVSSSSFLALNTIVPTCF